MFVRRLESQIATHLDKFDDLFYICDVSEADRVNSLNILYKKKTNLLSKYKTLSALLS